MEIAHPHNAVSTQAIAIINILKLARGLLYQRMASHPHIEKD
jgi:hypothetical protein